MTAVWIAALVALALGIAIGTRRATRRQEARLSGLRAAAETLASGDLSVRVPIEAHDATSALGRALNELATRTRTRLAAAVVEQGMRDAVLESLPQGVALLDPDLAIRHANRQFWALVGVEAPVGPRPHLAVARQPVLEEIAAEAVRRDRAQVREASLYVPERSDYEVAVSPVASEASPAWLMTITGLRPEREMANLRREFVANVSHELKTPLTSIRGYAETLLQGGLEDVEHRERFVETIRKQAIRLEGLVEDLLELADLDRPDAELELKDWDVGAIVRETAERFEEQARRRGLEFGLEARPGLRARCDRGRMEVALGNLIDNAVKYTERGRVDVRLTREGDRLRVTVADTGRGIASEHIPRVFERFYRVDPGRSRTLGGTGLGLAIVKHAVQMHGGELGVESRLGRGSTFWLEIPIGGPPARAGAASAGAGGQPPGRPQ
ncbi:MAG TPA: ATP-binding protein [Candidatus Eisenbacteria bacterium]|jgi:two-component system phosphate regulon sensor histidine kinase PhoR